MKSHKYAIRFLILVFCWNAILIFYLLVGMIMALEQYIDDINSLWFKQEI